MLNTAEEPTVVMAERDLKMTRKIAKASVTRKIKEITRLMCAIEDANEVIAIKSELNEAMENFSVHMTIIFEL